jgi:hypothetical protein
MLTHMPPDQVWFACKTSPDIKGSGGPSSESGPVPEPPSAQSPFAHLGRYPWWRDVTHLVRGRYPSFLAPTNSRARPKSSCRLRLSLFRPVFAGCCQPLLEDGPSRRYLHSLCKGAWTHTPPRSRGSVRLCAPPPRLGHWNHRTSASPRGLIELGTRNDPCNATSTGGGFRDCSHSLMFRLLYSLGLPVAPTAVTRTGQPGRLHHAMNMWLPALIAQGFT